MFSSVVHDYWRSYQHDVDSGDGYRVVTDASLPANRAISLLRLVDGQNILTLTPDRAEALGLSGSASVIPGDLLAALTSAEISLNDPDRIFYLPVAEQKKVRAEKIDGDTRPLTQDDADAFAEFVADAPADDLDEAFVELDHWLVFGTFVDGRLAAAASMYPWKESRLADLGVITLPEYRGRGRAKNILRAMSIHALRDGYEPQYRCQLDNAPSVALALASGFALFGEWEVIDSDE